MCCKGFFKRVFPFFLTFAVGLFIASFFVSIAAPSFPFNRGRRNHRQYDQRIELENQQLREENARLKREASERNKRDMTNYDFENDFDIPPPPSIPPPPRVKIAPYPGR